MNIAELEGKLAQAEKTLLETQIYSPNDIQVVVDGLKALKELQQVISEYSEKGRDQLFHTAGFEA